MPQGDGAHVFDRRATVAVSHNIRSQHERGGLEKALRPTKSSHAKAKFLLSGGATAAKMNTIRDVENYAILESCTSEPSDVGGNGDTDDYHLPVDALPELQRRATVSPAIRTPSPRHSRREKLAMSQTLTSRNSTVSLGERSGTTNSTGDHVDRNGHAEASDIIAKNQALTESEYASLDKVRESHLAKEDQDGYIQPNDIASSGEVFLTPRRTQTVAGRPTPRRALTPKLSLKPTLSPVHRSHENTASKRGVGAQFASVVEAADSSCTVAADIDDYALPQDAVQVLHSNAGGAPADKETCSGRRDSSQGEVVGETVDKQVTSESSYAEVSPGSLDVKNLASSLKSNSLYHRFDQGSYDDTRSMDV